MEPALSACPHCHSEIASSHSVASPVNQCPSCGRSLVPADDLAPALSLPVATKPAARRKSNAVRSALVACGAVAVTAAACWTLYRSLAPAQSEVSGPSPAAGMPAAETKDRASHLLVMRPGSGANASGTVVFLEPAKDVEDAGFPLIHRRAGILARAIVAEAFLMAAREEMGLATRDEWLGDARPDRTPVVTIGITVDRSVGTAAPGRSDSKGKLWNQVLPYRADDSLDYPKLVEQMESAARGRMLETLKQAGLAGRPNHIQSAGAVPEDVEKDLGRLGYVAQLDALRKLHTAVRKHGESPERLGAFVRGYANLGTLTEFLWTPLHKACKARALLYAQRLVARDPKSPWALCHRAYAKAFAGLHASALEDLAQAGVGSTGSARSPGLPDWAELIDAYCRFDVGRLAAASKGRNGSFARWLHFLAIEDEAGIAPLSTLASARALLAAEPDCFWAIDSMCARGGVSSLHVSTLLGPKMLDERVPREMLALADLPDPVRKAVQQERGEPDVVRALLAAGRDEHGTAEPTWATLGQLLRETRFVQVFRRFAFMRNAWSVPVDEYLAETQPLIADHPLRALFMAYADGSLTQTDPLAKRWVVPAGLEFAMNPIYRGTFQVNPYLFTGLTRMAYADSDDVYRDLALEAATIKNAGSIAILSRMHDVSPHAALPVALQLERDWNGSQARLAEWEQEFRQHATVMGNLGNGYAKANRIDDAVRCLRRFLDLSPDAWAYEKLADLYEAQGDAHRWQQTLEASLQEEDNGLDHARVRVKLANHFMKEGNYAKAQPYAEAAAQTWAEWAMRCACQCYAGLEDWDRSELWIRRTAERYPSARSAWLSWCIATGHGHARQAALLATEYFDAIGEPQDDDDRVLLIFHSLLVRQPQRALKPLEEHTRKAPQALEGLHLALLADQAGDPALRDQALGQVASSDPTVKQFMELLLNAFSKGSELDLEEIERVIKSADKPRACDLYYFTGRFLEQHGRRDDARRYLKRCVDSPECKPHIRLLSAVALDDLEQAKPPEQVADPRASRKV